MINFNSEEDGTKRSFLGGIGRVLSHRQFRLLWWSNGIHSLGAWLFKVAVGWWTWELTHSTYWLGVIAFAHTFPLVIMSIFAGVWADKIGYRRVMILSQAPLVLAGILMTALAFSNLLDLFSIVILTTVVGVADAVTTPPRLSMVHDLVPSRDLSAAISLNSVTYNVSRMVGPAIAGALIVWLNLSSVIALAALSFVIFFAALFFLDETKNKNDFQKKSNMIRDLFEGFKYSWNHPEIRFILILLSVTALLIRPYIDLLPGISEQFYNAGPEGLSMLLAATGVGATVCGVWLTQRGRNQGLTQIYVLSFLLSGIAIILFAISDILWIGVIIAGFAGFFIICGAISGQTLIQIVVDSRVRARVISIQVMLSWGLPAIGALILGGIADYVGLQITLAAGGLLTALLWIWASNKGRQMTSSFERKQSHAD
ncbi:MAG: MFS transporter [Pseudomonadota bacterium]|nr:MFS transporter [Pseudomonadota bacterium]